MLSRTFKIIVGYGANRGIGLNNRLPWLVNAKDMEHFRKTTTGEKKNVVIMGRNTYESIGKPLPNRLNIVVTSKAENIKSSNVVTATSLDHALCLANDKTISDIFVIGGERLYKSALNHKLLEKVIATELSITPEADTFFPKLPGYFHKTQTLFDNHNINNCISEKMRIVEYSNLSNQSSSENNYLKLLQNLLDKGTVTDSRSGKVSSTFTRQLNYNIELVRRGDDFTNNIYVFPIMTTKRLYFRRVFEELMWMLRGQTDSTILAEQGNHIWDGNTSRQALDKLDLPYKEGELGPGYGAQMIHWGGQQNFVDGSLQMNGGINQVKYVINELKCDPFSRRAMINLWNPTDLNKMALPPCHTSYYFSVTPNPSQNVLNCNVVLRSNDLFLGNPFNQVFTQLLTTFIAHSIGMIPGTVGMTMMIPHIYHNHFDQVRTQLCRVPLKYPTLQITKPLTSYEDIIGLQLDDVKLENYYYWPKLSAPMAV